jgi:GxxExxY protein
LDILVENLIVIEIKTVDDVLPIHEAQLLTYLKLGGWQVGLIINFNVPLLKQGIYRRVLGLKETKDSVFSAPCPGSCTKPLR